MGDPLPSHASWPTAALPAFGENALRPAALPTIAGERRSGGDIELDLADLRFPRAKRALDVLGAFTLLVITTPLLILIAIAIRLDSPGPIIYSQERVGLNRRRRQRRQRPQHAIPNPADARDADRRRQEAEGRPFQIYKFRTMRADAENGGPQWAEKDDPRVTRTGRVLRAARLDELPQLWNVLCGDMSLVGPRPERPHFVGRFARHIPKYRHRLIALPGITGLAQIEHQYDRCEDDVKRKLAYDLDYIRGYHITRDIRILLKTVVVMITGKGAH